MVIYENIKLIESTIKVYGDMQVIKRPFYSMIPCKSYTVPYKLRQRYKSFFPSKNTES